MQILMKRILLQVDFVDFGLTGGKESDCLVLDSKSVMAISAWSTVTARILLIVGHVQNAKESWSKIDFVVGHIN